MGQETDARRKVSKEGKNEGKNEDEREKEQRRPGEAHSHKLGERVRRETRRPLGRSGRKAFRNRQDQAALSPDTHVSIALSTPASSLLPRGFYDVQSTGCTVSTWRSSQGQCKYMVSQLRSRRDIGEKTNEEAEEEASPGVGQERSPLSRHKMLSRIDRCLMGGPDNTGLVGSLSQTLRSEREREESERRQRS